MSPVEAGGLDLNSSEVEHEKGSSTGSESNWGELEKVDEVVGSVKSEGLQAIANSKDLESEMKIDGAESIPVPVVGFVIRRADSSPSVGVPVEAEEANDGSELISMVEAGSTVGASEKPITNQAGNSMEKPNHGEAGAESVEVSAPVEVSARQGETLEMDYESELADKGEPKIEITAVEAESVVGASEVVHAGTLVGEVNVEGVLFESADISHGAEIIGRPETESLESVLNLRGAECDSVEISDENAFTKEDGQHPDITITEAGSKLGSDEAMADLAPEGFEAGSLNGLPNPGEFQAESSDISHGESGRDVQVQGNESELVKEDENAVTKEDGQHPGITITEAGSKLGSAEATTDLAPEGFEAGSLNGLPNPGELLSESSDISHGESGRDVQVQGNEIELVNEDENAVTKEDGQHPDIITDAGSKLGSAEATADLVAEGFEAGSMNGLPSPGYFQAESSDISHGESGRDVHVQGNEIELVNEDEIAVTKEDGQHPDIITDAGSKLGSADTTADLAPEGFEAGSVNGLPSPGDFQAESSDISHGESGRDVHVQGNESELVKEDDQKPETSLEVARSGQGDSEAPVDTSMEEFKAGSFVGMTNPEGTNVESMGVIGDGDDGIRVEVISCGKDSSTNPTIINDLFDGDVPTSVSVPDDRELDVRSIGDQKSETEATEMDMVRVTARTAAAAAAADGGVEIKGSQVELNARVQVVDAEIRNEAEHMEEGVSCLGRDLLEGHLQTTEFVLGDGDDVQTIDPTMEELQGGSFVGILDPKGTEVEPVEIIVQEDVRVEEDISCDENPSTKSTINHDLFDGHVSTSVGVPDDREVESIGEQKPETEAIEMDITTAARMPAAAADGGVEIEGSQFETNIGVPVEGAEICSITKQMEEAVSGCDLIADHLQSTECVLGDGDNGQNQVEVVVDCSAGTENMTEGPSLGFNQEPIVMVEETQDICGSMVDTDKIIQNEGIITSGDREQNIVVDGDRIDPVDDILEDPYPDGSVVEKQKLNSYPSDKNLMDLGDLVASGSDPEPISIVPAAKAESGDGHLVNDDLVVTGVFETTDVILVEDFKGIEQLDAQSADEDATKKGNTLMVDVTSVSGVPVVLNGEFFSPDDSLVILKSEPKSQALSPAYDTDAFTTDGNDVLINESEEGAEHHPLKSVPITPWTSSAGNSQQARYYLPPIDVTEFFISDLVWGKVKSHPWWPGQIIDPSDASELASKHQRKDNFLIAYFGDGTFAWRDESQLKSFQQYYSQMVTQSNSDVFIDAVSGILGEISRRVELGMACVCLPKEDYADIKYQKFENAGIRGGFNISFFDRSQILICFEPKILLEYIKSLAVLPTGGADRLELVTARAQLKAYYHSKGFPELPEFIVGGELKEHDTEVAPCRDKESMKQIVDLPTPISSGLIPEKRKRGRPPGKNKRIFDDCRKQNNTLESVEEKRPSRIENGGGKKNRVFDPDCADSEKSKRKRLESEGNLESVTPLPTLNSSSKVEESFDTLRTVKKGRQNPFGDLEKKSPPSILSFKVGECIRRVASQLTGVPTAPPILKSSGEKIQKAAYKADNRCGDVEEIGDFLYFPLASRRRKTDISVDYSSSDEMLSNLCLAATDQMKRYSFLSTIISFFTDFRNFCASDSSMESTHDEKMDRNRSVNCQSSSSDKSTPDHMKDSYWCDMVHHISSEKGKMSNDLKRKGETNIRGPKKKRKPAGKSSPSLMLGPKVERLHQLQVGAISPNTRHALAAERSIISVEEKIVDTPTALILCFNSSDSLPTETNLIRIFSRYGPLKEAETEVLRKNNRVKVVFKRRADAEIAFSSAGKFSTFGPSLVSYQLRYLPSAPKASPHAESKNDAPLVLSEGCNLEGSETGLLSDTTQVKAVVDELQASSRPSTESKNDIALMSSEGCNLEVSETGLPLDNTQVEAVADEWLNIL